MPSLSPAQLASMRLISASTPDGRTAVVEIQENQGTDDGALGQTDNWVTVRSYDCEIKAVQAQMKTTQSNEITAGEVYQFFLPWDAEVNLENRLRSDGVIYLIRNGNFGATQRINLIITAVRIGEGAS